MTPAKFVQVLGKSLLFSDKDRVERQAVSDVKGAKFAGHLLIRKGNRIVVVGQAAPQVARALGALLGKSGRRALEVEVRD